jgi:hypothetical protein
MSAALTIYLLSLREDRAQCRATHSHGRGCRGKGPRELLPAPRRAEARRNHDGFARQVCSALGGRARLGARMPH